MSCAVSQDHIYRWFWRGSQSACLFLFCPFPLHPCPLSWFCTTSCATFPAAPVTPPPPTLSISPNSDPAAQSLGCAAIKSLITPLGHVIENGSNTYPIFFMFMWEIIINNVRHIFYFNYYVKSWSVVIKSHSL